MTDFDFDIERSTLPDTYQYAFGRLERGHPRAMEALLRAKLNQDGGRMTIAALLDLGYQIARPDNGDESARRDDSELGEQEKWAVQQVLAAGREGMLMADLTSIGLTHAGHDDNQQRPLRARYFGMLGSLIRRDFLIEGQRGRVWAPEFAPGGAA